MGRGWGGIEQAGKFRRVGEWRKGRHRTERGQRGSLQGWLGVRKKSTAQQLCITAQPSYNDLYNTGCLS